MPRRHDIDALRVIAFALLILYHVGMVYVAGWGFHIKSDYQAEWLQYPMIFLNRWRMPLLFAISGIAIGLSLPGRNPLRFGLLRCWRLLLPLAFGMLFVVSVQAYAEGVNNGALEPGYGGFMWRYLQIRPWPAGTFAGATHGITWNHLWYLAYLWVYSMILLALTPVLQTRPARRLQAWLVRPRHAALLLLPAWYFFAILIVLLPRFPATHTLRGDWYLHAEYFPVFMLGYLIARADGLWKRLHELRWSMLLVALLSISVELSLRAAGRYLPVGEIPVALRDVPWGMIERGGRALYMWSALLAIFGWGCALLNRPFRWLPYATEAVYPWYVLHQSLIVPLAYLLVTLSLGPVLEPVLLVLGTVLGCLLLHEFVIRRIAVLRPLFGLKAVPRKRTAALATAP